MKVYPFILALTMALFASLDAKLEDHFKKVTGKGPNHHIEEIDFIYMINLDVRPEKYADCVRQFEPYGIHPFRFSAVNGWELSLDVINDVGVKYKPGMPNYLATYYSKKHPKEKQDEHMHVPGRTYFVHDFARGTIGIALSHLSVLQDAYDSGYETIWVLEDDVHVDLNPHFLSEFVNKLDKKVGRKNWDLLFTDKDYRNGKGEYVPCTGYDRRRPNFQPKSHEKFKMRKNIDRNFKKVGARFGAHSIIYSRSGMKKLLDFFKKYNIYEPYDIDNFAVPGINLYCLRHNIVSNTPGGLSDNGRPHYQKKAKGNK